MNRYRSGAVPGRFHPRCAGHYAFGTAVASFRAAPTPDSSMGITSGTGPMAVRPAWITWYCSAGTIITWFMKVALPARSLLMEKSDSKPGDSNPCRTGPSYPKSPMITMSNSGWIESSSQRERTARVVTRNGMPAREWTGRWQCRRCSRTPDVRRLVFIFVPRCPCNNSNANA